MEQIFINASRQCQVVIGPELLRQAGSLALKVLPVCRIAIIADSAQVSTSLPLLRESLSSCGYTTETIVLRSGEDAADLKTVSRVLHEMAEHHFGKQDAVFALGGGTADHVAGLAAAVYRRGIALVLVPTTLRAAVDTAIGGKNGVRIPPDGVEIGTVRQPRLVLCDTRTLHELRAERITDGMAEVVRYAFVTDRSFFRQLCDGLNAPDVDTVLERMIARCVRIKGDMVARDEEGGGLQKLLEFGAPVADAIRRCGGGKLSHGECLAAGMAVTARAAERAGLCLPVTAELKKTMENYGLSADCPFGRDEIAGALTAELTRQGGSVTLILPKQIGQMRTDEMTVRAAAELLLNGLPL